MAERRMFAKSVIDSDEFIDMPVTARLLYYDFAMRADDDGFVNSPKKIMRIIGASQKDLSALIQNQFVIPFDNGVIVIRHWRIHNYIRKDTYNATRYTDQKNMLELDESKAYVLCSDKPSTSRRRKVNELSTQDNKDSIGEDSISTSSSDDDQRVDYQSVVDLYNSICISRPKVKTLTDKRKTAIRKRLFEVGGDMSELQKVFEAVEASSFLSGRNGKWDGCSFDWIMRQENFVKITEDSYKDPIFSSDQVKQQTITRHSDPPIGYDTWSVFLKENGFETIEEYLAYLEE